MPPSTPPATLAAQAIRRLAWARYGKDRAVYRELHRAAELAEGKR